MQDYIQEYTSNPSIRIFRLGYEEKSVVRKKQTAISINKNLQKKDKILRNFLENKWNVNKQGYVWCTLRDSRILIDPLFCYMAENLAQQQHRRLTLCVWWREREGKVCVDYRFLPYCTIRNIGNLRNTKFVKYGIKNEKYWWTVLWNIRGKPGRVYYYEFGTCESYYYFK